MRVTFFRVAERKSPKKGRPPVCDPFALRRGDLRRGDCWVRRGTRFALARAARTATASQLTRHGRSDAHAHPATAPPQAQPAGGWAAEQPDGPLLRSASRSRREAPARSGPSEAMARMDVRSRVPFRMRRGAQGPADQGSRLSERSETKRVRARPRWTRAPQVSPLARRAGGDAGCRVAFSLVTCFWRSKRKLLRRRAHTPASALGTGMQPTQRTCPGFDKLSPNG